MNAQTAIRQRLLTEAVLHMRKQGAPSVSGNKLSCVYRTTDGKMCAFAPAIENYDGCLERNTAADLLTKYSERLHEWVRDCDIGFAIRIQKCHDVNARLVNFLDEFEADARILAETHGLVYPELSESESITTSESQ